MRGFGTLGILVAAGFMAVCAAYGAEPMSPADREFFEKTIRPLFAEHCFECHGPDEQKSDLRLDHIDTILKGGERGPAIVPGKPEESRLIEAVEYLNVDLQMPPKYMLDDEAYEALVEWVRRGAPWPDEPLPEAGTVAKETFDLEARKESHWAWQPVRKYKPPTVSDTSWPASPIDRFILAKLEENGLEPAPEADKRTLIRRLSYALTGLPPTPDEIANYVNDEAPDAYERLVDRLLASPRFGERWGRHWLDLVRYAETYGHEQDYPIREAWRYRDYVIRALNSDVPYDDLIREHIAGDLIENPRRHPEEGYNESIVGTGFWFLHQATHSPVDVRQDEADRIDNQIDVMSKAFLGMTVSCARCHDHKFDAISTKDYYGLVGFLQSSRQQFAFLDPKGEIYGGLGTLTELKSRNAKAVRKYFKDLSSDGAEEIAEYLLAADEVMHGEWRDGDSEALLRPDILFDDFEDGEFDRWNIEGDAFGDEPLDTSDQRRKGLSGFEGQRVASSWTDKAELTGRMISDPFLIERRYLRFRLSGPNDPEHAAVRLIVGDAVVRSATGRDSKHLVEEYWDVSELVGKRARLEVVDEATDEDGHITIDRILFSEHLYVKPIRRNVARVANERGLDAERLERWVRALHGIDPDDVTHPMHAWLSLASAAAQTDGDDFAKRVADFRDSIERRRRESEEAGETYTVFEDFEGEMDDWFSTGFAFIKRTTSPEDWRLEDGRIEVPTPGAVHSGMLSDKLQGVLRSPTFTITHDSINYRIAGTGGRIRLVVEGYQLREFNGLLFDSTLFETDTGGEWRWHHETGDIYKWIGREAYIEIVDDGDGWVAVDEIRFSNERPAPDPPFTVDDNEPEPASASLENLAVRYEELAREAIENRNRKETDKDAVEWLRWLMAEDFVPVSESHDSIAAMAEAKQAIETRLPDPSRALAITDGTPDNEFVFIRGSHKNPGDTVPRRFLEAVSGTNQEPIDDGSGRLELAEHILAPDNPLTARVIVNRIWHYVFGEGIVPSVDNFGALGEEPTHPELLDYLARRFREDGWSVKGLIRDLVTSSTYKMSSAPCSSKAEQLDPANTLLHRMRLKRLEGEAIRDSILYVSGQLDETMYGPSVPIYISKFMEANRRPPESGPIDGDRRRTIYVEVRRNFLSPMMLAFDTPVPDTTIGARTVSNIPAQALILMNNPFVVQMAEAWGKSLAEDTGRTADERIHELYERALGREPTADETGRMLEFIREQSVVYGLSETEAQQSERIWSDLCHVIFNLKEFIFIA